MLKTASQTELKIPNLDALDDFARQFAGQIQLGDVLALTGEMGTGKTTLVQHLGKHWGLTERITSPTFVLIHDYTTGTVPVVHVDLYRLEEAGSESIAQELLGVIEEEKSILIVEWAEYGEFLAPYVTHQLHLHYDAAEPDSDKREMTLQSKREMTFDGF